MIKRYNDSRLVSLWSDENKVAMWQKVELAVIKARALQGKYPLEIYQRIFDALTAKPVNINRWLEIEKNIHHDLNAFVAERKENMSEDLRRHFHDGITSYDTEEPALALILFDSCECVIKEIIHLEDEIISMAKKYCFTPMNARTHGQEAEMQSFGARCLTWLTELRLGAKRLVESRINLRVSKLSGAIGKYGTISPELEKEALEILNLEPFYGATQIVPRSLYLPTAQALCQVTQAVNKIAHDIRLCARSGKPLMQEPFGKKQTGSSAMPQKKNPILTEKIAGMERIAVGCLTMIQANSLTWEERAIEQSSCERVAWPDLFQATIHTTQTLIKVLKGLKVYPDNMLWEIINSRGCYAAAQAKDWLKENGPKVGIDEESAYRIVQLAAFNVHEPSELAEKIREKPSDSFTAADVNLLEAYAEHLHPTGYITLGEIIPKGSLRCSKQLDHTPETVAWWNKALLELFRSDYDLLVEWNDLFRPSHLLCGEEILFKEILDWERQSK